jgi:hypothetical protein
LIIFQMIRVISSPSSSTTVPSTLTLDTSQFRADFSTSLSVLLGRITAVVFSASG